jgi:hypothetical protein
MKIDEFYAECAALLGTTDECEAFTHYRRNRWNNRKPGRGRFPEHGIIRSFGEVVHIHLHSPKKIAGVFDSHDAALEHLRREMS